MMERKQNTKRCCRLAVCLTAVLCILLSGMSTAGAAQSNNSYIRGDANGDGTVTVADATVIQRVLTELDRDTDGQITLRADITGDGLDIADATMIQCYLAECGNEFHIGEEVVINTTDSTEPSSSQPFVNIPVAEDELPYIWNW